MWQWKTTKTHQDATYQLPGWAVESLRRRMEIRELEAASAGEMWVDEPEMVDDRLRPVTARLLFCRLDEKPLTGANVGRDLRQVTESAGLPEVSPHGLRHSCASILIAQGARLMDVQKLLRHRRQALTADLYTHLVGEVQQSHVQQMEWLGDE